MDSNNILMIARWVGLVLIVLAWFQFIPLLIGWIGFGVAAIAFILESIFKKNVTQQKSDSKPG